MNPWQHAAHHAGCATGLIMAGFCLALRRDRWAAFWGAYAAAFTYLTHCYHHDRRTFR